MNPQIETGILRQSPLTILYLVLGFAALALGYADCWKLFDVSWAKTPQLMGLAAVFLSAGLLQMASERLRGVGALTASRVAVNLVVAGATLHVAVWCGAFELSRNRHDDMGMIHIALFFAAPAIAFLSIHLHHARENASLSRAVAVKWTRDIALTLAGLVASIAVLVVLKEVVTRSHRPPVLWWWGCVSTAAVVSFVVYRLGARAGQYVRAQSWLRTALVVPPLAAGMAGLLAFAAMEGEGAPLVFAGLCGVLLLTGTRDSAIATAISWLLCVAAAAGTAASLLLGLKYALVVVPIGVATTAALGLMATDRRNAHIGVLLIAVGCLVAALVGPIGLFA